MPKLSEVQENTESTWADQVDKNDIANLPFWIHGCKPSEYTDDQGRDVNILVLNITIGDPTPKGPRAVITVGRTEQREGILSYFNEGKTEPLGPCITYSVPMKGGRSFWRIEDAPEDGAQPVLFSQAKRR